MLVMQADIQYKLEQQETRLLLGRYNPSLTTWHQSKISEPKVMEQLTIPQLSTERSLNYFAVTPLHKFAVLYSFQLELIKSVMRSRFLPMLCSEVKDRIALTSHRPVLR